MRAKRILIDGRIAVLLAVALLAGGCASGSLRLQPASGGDLATRARNLLVRAAQDETDVVRANAIEALLHTAPTDGLPYFRSALQSDKPMVRFAGCAALGELRDKASLPGIRRLLNDSEQRVRLGAAFAAYRCGERGRAELLVNALNNHPEEDLRAEAAYLVGKLGDKAALKRLLLATRREKSTKVQMHIYAAMALLGDRAAADELMRAAVQSDPVAKLIGLQSLVELRDPAAEEALRFRLRETGEYLQTRLLAARGLGRLGSNAGYDLALDALDGRGSDDTETMQIRSLAALALGAIGDRRALTALETLASVETDPRVQVAACYAILEITGR